MVFRPILESSRLSLYSSVDPGSEVNGTWVDA
jgi:hypothetical protein